MAIDEKKLIEDLVYCKGLGRKSCEAVLETINKQPKVGEWIPVSERLPEVLDNLENEDSFMKSMYLITDGYGVVVSLFDGVFRDMIDFEKYNDVLAWMPLPEPYKGE